MPSWIAVSFGALDVRDVAAVDQQYSYVVTPITAASPLYLLGEGARVWERLVDGPLGEDTLSDDDLQLIREMEQAGIASPLIDHPNRIREVHKPWMSSPMHELVYALLQSVADAHGIDLVFIKGPTLHAQGLRDREHSGDVDCWVRIGDETRFAEAMSAWGWKPALSPFTGTRVLHSLTLRAGDWGSAIDVHSWFPGMAIDHSRAFDEVRSTSEPRRFGGVLGRTPHTQVHAIISALHDVRPVLGRAVADSEIESASVTLGRAGTEVIEVSRAFGSDFALAPALRRAFPYRELDFTTAIEPADWAWRSQSEPLRVYREAMKLIPGRERPRVLFRVIWPTEESLLAGPLRDRVGTVPTWRLRIERIRHGVAMALGARRR